METKRVVWMTGFQGLPGFENYIFHQPIGSFSIPRADFLSESYCFKLFLRLSFWCSFSSPLLFRVP